MDEEELEKKPYAWIAKRILGEQRKHEKHLDDNEWAYLAAAKIASSMQSREENKEEGVPRNIIQFITESRQKYGQAIIDLLEKYDTRFGDTQVYITPNQYIVYTYNGGHSHNEELDRQTQEVVSPDASRHPESVYSFSRAVYEYHAPYFCTYMDTVGEEVDSWEYKLEY